MGWAVARLGTIAIAGSILAGCALLYSIGERAEPQRPQTRPSWTYQEAYLDARQVVPRHKGDAGGTIYTSLETATGQWTWEATVARLTGPAIALGIHGPANAGQNGPIIFSLPVPEASVTIKGKLDLTPAQIEEMEAGKWYLSVATEKFPQGEARGQIVRSDRGTAGN